MLDVNEITAAPHLPEAMKSNIAALRPESIFAFLAEAFETDTSIEVRLREGEIFIAITAS